MAGLLHQAGRRLNGTPQKRLFLSIIADYDLTTGLSELIDNAIDHWTDSGRPSSVRIDVDLEVARQLITVTDNAGGVKEDSLELLIAPGASRSSRSQELIGIFGVGGKRAGVALGERVEIRTRHAKAGSFGINIDKDWLETDDWGIESFPVQQLNPGTTSVHISSLRQPFGDDDVERMRVHLGETYSWFISKGCKIYVNRRPVAPIRFDKWAFPPDYPPRKVQFTIEPTNLEQLSVRFESGLILDRDPEEENYGVYFYCNERLIVKELRTRDVGYLSREAGVPHPDASLCRVLVWLNGPPELMPWDSSKSGLNLNHPSFTHIRGQLIQLLSYYSTLSRRLKNNWDEGVFAYKRGTMQTERPEEGFGGHRIVLPELPRARPPRYIDELEANNSRALKKKPWIRGVIDSLGFVDLIFKTRAGTKNRAALILTDSNFEIALKEYIVHEPEAFPPRQFTDSKIAELLADRRKLLRAVEDRTSAIPKGNIDVCLHYADLKSRLATSRVTPAVSDQEITEYRAVTDMILRTLLKVRITRR